VSNADTKADVTRGDHEDDPPPSTSSQIGRFIKWMREAGCLLLGLVSLAAVTGLYFWLDVPLVATAFTYWVVLVLLSLVSNFSSLIVLSFIGVGCLNYFFTPPIYSFRVDYPTRPHHTIRVCDYLTRHQLPGNESSRRQSKIGGHQQSVADRERGAQAGRTSIAGKRTKFAFSNRRDSWSRCGPSPER
jgi:hypothetical protein